jgi:hypothetical protein
MIMIKRYVTFYILEVPIAPRPFWARDGPCQFATPVATRTNVSMALRISGRSRGQTEPISASSKPARVLICASAARVVSVTCEVVGVSGR